MDEINRTFQETGNIVRDNIPHIKLPESQPIDDPFINKFRKWALIILTFAVVGGVALFIILKLINRFF